MQGPLTRLRLPVLDAALAAALVAYAVVNESTATGVPHPWSTLVGALWAATVVLRTAAPLVMAALASAAGVVYALLPVATTQLWSFPALLVICFSIGLHLTGRRMWTAAGLVTGSVYVIQILTSTRPGGVTDFSDVYLSPIVLVGGPLLPGLLLRRSRSQTAELRRLGTELAAEREAHARTAAAEERNRIARELHDVISHSVSVMVVQAGAAQGRLPEGSPALEQLHAIRRTGKDTLTELRRQLGVLRDAPAGSPSPVPGLADVVPLADEAGAELEYDEQRVGDVPPGIALAAYRVSQEALTNARKHAEGSHVRVRIDRTGGLLRIEIVNGPGRAWVVPSPPGSGHGLAGMAERVAMYGGELSVGATDGGGWRVAAELPIPPGPAT